LLIFFFKEATAVAFKHMPLDKWIKENYRNLHAPDKIIIINISEYLISGSSSAVFLFIMFKMKRIEIQLNPNYTTAQ
jgi:hypothetical protein